MKKKIIDTGKTKRPVDAKKMAAALGAEDTGVRGNNWAEFSSILTNEEARTMKVAIEDEFEQVEE